MDEAAFLIVRVSFRWPDHKALSAGLATFLRRGSAMDQGLRALPGKVEPVFRFGSATDKDLERFQEKWNRFSGSEARQDKDLDPLF